MKIKEALKQINSLSLYSAQCHGYERIGKRLNVFYNRTQWNSAALSLNCEQPGATVEMNLDRLTFYNHDTQEEWKEFYKVVSILEEVRKTPIDKRFPEKEYRLVANPDALETYGTNAAKYVSCIHFGSDEFSFIYGAPTAFTEKELEQIKKAYPWIAPAIDAMKEEVTDESIS